MSVITIKDLIDFCADSNIELESLYQYKIEVQDKELAKDIHKYIITTKDGINYRKVAALASACTLMTTSFIVCLVLGFSFKVIALTSLLLGIGYYLFARFINYVRSLY